MCTIWTYCFILLTLLSTRVFSDDVTITLLVMTLLIVRIVREVVDVKENKEKKRKEGG